MTYVFRPQKSPSVAVAGTADVFPVHRIYCVGQNYASHAREMGANPEREAPFFFSKPADAVCPEGSRLPFPLATENLHHEIELVVAIGKTGTNILATEALDYVFGYAVGLDLTRRDLQSEAKKKGRPWATARALTIPHLVPPCILSAKLDTLNVDQSPCPSMENCGSREIFLT